MRPNSLEEQILLEEESSRLSLSRLERREEQAADRGDAENSQVGRLAVNMLVEPVQKKLDDFLGKSKTGSAGRKSALAKHFDDLPLTTEEIAFLSVRAVLNMLLRYRREPITDARMSAHISMRLVDEMFLRSVRKETPHLLKKWEKECNDRSLTREHSRTFMMRQARNLEMNWTYVDPTGQEWDDAHSLKMGRVILEAIVQATSICYVKTVSVRPKDRRKLVCISEHFEEFLGSAKDHVLSMSPWFLPMVVKPTPWTVENGLFGGGYKTDNIRKSPLVKRASSGWLDEIIENDPEPLLSAVNAIQETAWRVNPVIRDALEHVYNQDKGIAGLPNSSKRELPPAPEEFSKDYRRACWEVHETNRKDLTRRLAVTQSLWLAHKFSEYERFYFPHDLDSRGRVYPKPAFLNPQGPDYVKGLLEFADGKPLGTEEAAAWLAVHVANCWGEDKLALDDRIAWTEGHEDLLRDVSRAPLDDLRWTQADEPFQFLAAALSWCGYLDQGLDYICHTPIAVDATCSGLQHYAGLLRDPVGGKSVNLTALPERQDVYLDVAKAAEELVRADLSGDSANLAQAWLDFGITRKITKRSVMVVPYAATFVSCMDYTRDGVKERLEAGEELPWVGDFNEFIVYGAKKIWAAIENTVVSASEAMRWISTAASTYAKHSDQRYLTWGTPSGFVVRQRKPKSKFWRMDTILDGSRIRMGGRIDQAHLDPVKMSSSTPPSFIHSLDAAHMCLSIDAALFEGIESFGVVHDSFSTHASDMGVFSQCIRDTFHEMYTSQDVLDGLRQSLQRGLEEELPPLPEQGDLDLSEVRQSTFFFS